MAAARHYMNHGVTVGIGTDGSASSDNQNMFEAIRAAAFISRVRGVPPAEWISTADAFTMATEGSARVLGMQDFIGKIARGYKADLVLLDGDPLADIANAHRIAAVMTRGRFYDRIALDAMLRDV